MGSRTVLLSLLILPALVYAESSKEVHNNVIGKIEVQRHAEATEVVLHGKMTPTFTVFKLKDPDRLIVDLIRTEVQVERLPDNFSGSHISKIATTQFKQSGNVVGRVVIGMQTDVQFRAKTVGSAVVITFAKKEALSKRPSKPSPPSLPVIEPDEPKPDHRVVESRGDKLRPNLLRIEKILTGARSLSLTADSDINTYEVLEVFDPFRIVLDVYGASMPAGKHNIERISDRYVSNVRMAGHKNKVRIVLDCAQGTPKHYSIQRTKKKLVVLFADGKKSAIPNPAHTKKNPIQKSFPVDRTAAKSKDSKPINKYAVLKDVSFRQHEGEARVILDLEGEATAQVVHVDASSSMLEIPHCNLPLLLERTLDTSEFGGSIKSLSAYRVPDKHKVKLVVLTSRQVENRLERKDGKLHWVLVSKDKKPSVRAASSEGKKTYTYAPDQVAGYSVRHPEAQASASGGRNRSRYQGKRISLDFKDADIHNILRLISEVARLNIITSDEVKGKITVTMRNVPWDQALDIILKTKKLGKVQHGNIIRVATLEELAKEKELLAKAAEANKKLEPIRVRLIPVNYATAKDIEAQVKDVLSDRGSVTVDDRTNVLIVKDVLEHLVKAEGLVRSLDTETPQVLIEARIVEANTQFVREIGVQWGGDMSFASATGNPTGLPFPNNIVVRGGADDQATNRPFSGTGNPGQFAINLPAAVGAGSGGALGFIFGSAGGIARLNLRLSALENKGAVKIISAPKIATLDNHKAKIGQGVSIPIAVVSAAGVNTQFVEAKLELEVTPHITQEGSILMAIKVTKNEPDFSRTGARGDPTILKKEAETQVMVRDGDTTVIGGIYTKKTSDTVTGIPFFSSIPILGYLFRNVKKNDDRTELLIFITPRIVNRLQATVSQK